MGDTNTLRAVTFPANLEALPLRWGDGGTIRILPLWEQQDVVVLSLSSDISRAKLDEAVSR